MERLEFEDYEEFACDIADKYESIRNDEYNDVAVVAKYEEAKHIIKELLCIGYDIHSIEMHDDEWDGYNAEYICSIYDDEIWCEPMLRENGYLTDDSSIMYVMDNCSSKVIPYCKGKAVYEVSVGDTDSFENDDEKESETERIYTVNGKSVDKKTFDEYVSKFAPKLVQSDDNEDETSDNDDYSISVKCNLDADEALEIIADMERRMMHMNDMFREMDNFRRLFNW